MIGHYKVSGLILFMAGFFNATIYCQVSNSDTTQAFQLGAAYQGDFITNFHGGINSGGGYLGLANLIIEVNTQNLGLWKGGYFRVNGANTHGATPSADFIGDMQVVSNIEAGDHSFLQELYYRHQWNHFEIIAGLQDMNVEFAASDHAALFLNSSFGMIPTISHNIDAPIFPLTALGITAVFELSEDVNWLNAIYDGCPTGFNHNPYNLRWIISTVDGIVGISEVQFKQAEGRNQTIKIGIFSHYHKLENEISENTSESFNTATMGIYGYFDREIWSSGNQKLGCFSQAGFSPSDASTSDFYLGVGINFNGLLSKSGDDTFGIAFAHEHFSFALAAETAVELTYHYQLNTNINIQPDIQYIINPAGTGVTLNNALIFGLRLGVEL